MRLAFIPPMTPTLIDQPPTRGEWATEVKFDGWRCQLVIDSKGTRVFTRRGHDWTDSAKKQGGVTWLNAGIIGRVRHLKGEDKLRHARLMAFWTG